MTEYQLSQLERLAKLKEQGILTDEELVQQKARIMAGDSPIQIEKATPAETAVRTAPEKKKPSAGKVAAILVGAIVVLSVIGKISDNSTPRPLATDTADTSSYISTDTATSTEYTSPVPENWSYYDDTDKMGSRIVTASTDSKNQLQFDFPYSGGSTATLTLRRKKGDTDAYVRISKGQLLINDYEGSHCRVRFDEGKPVTYEITGPSDHSSDIFFIDSAGGFIKRLKKAKTVVIEAEFYQAGFQQMEFDVSDLKWKY